MQWLTLIPEDSGVQRLKADNRKPAVARAVDSVAPYPSIHPVQIGEQPGKRRRHNENRRQGERRRGEDRRREQIPVILDTRSNHDRRALQNRRSADIEDETTDAPLQRINVYA
ncbi:MAG TPA: hypothetical protein ENJ80_02065 [Gammaproteobacteria bacterium]|nr:hypothetical protein [Gammaproteobacteria bacterium]